MFKYTRSPNFLGEILIYLSFPVCVGIWEIYILFIIIWIALLGTFIMAKELSNSKKKGWDEYTKHSWVLLPKVFPKSDLNSVLFYSIGIFIILNLYYL